MHNIPTPSQIAPFTFVSALLALVFFLASCAQNPMNVTRRDDRYAACEVKGASLVVADLHGNPYLTIMGGWPQTAIRLPVGTYMVTAQWDGKTATREVALDGKPGDYVYFHWQNRTPTDADPGTAH